MNSSTVIKAVSVALAAFCLSGCISRYHLPEVAGKSVSYRRTDPLGGTSITAKGVEVTADRVKAAEVVWTTVYPAFSVSLSVEGYERARTP